MVRHNNMIHNVHLKFDWQDKVKTWFNQPGRKHRRRVLRKKKAALIAPNPTHKLRPIVRGQTNKYNLKIKLGRGFTVKELKEAGIRGLSYARSLGIAVDLRRKDTSKETLDLNAGRIKEYLYILMNIFFLKPICLILIINLINIKIIYYPFQILSKALKIIFQTLKIIY